MGISPLEMNGMVGRTQDYSTIKQNEDNKAYLTNANVQTRVEEKAEKQLSTVHQGDDADMNSHSFDASDKGNGEYAGDGGRNRKKHTDSKDGKVIIKNHGGFDIKI